MHFNANIMLAVCQIRKRLAFLVAAAMLFMLMPPMFGASAAAVEPLLPSSLQKLYKKHKISTARTAVVVYRLSDQKILAAHLLDRLFNPASLAKLPLTFAAFDLLGSDYVWKTAVAVDSKINNGELQGNLYLIGGGDPLLDDARFLSLISRLRGRGLRTINGEVIIDDSYFVFPPHNVAAFDKKPFRPYNAGGSALAVNFNAQEIVVVPESSTVRVVVEPPNIHLHISNKISTVSRGGCRYWRQRLRERYSGDRQQATVLLRGKFTTRCKVLSFYTSALSPASNAAGVFGGLWQRLGGQWDGQWRVDKTPTTATTLLVHQSPPLLQAAVAMNKFSNNVIARNLLLSLPASNAKPPYTLPQARDTLHQWMREQGIDGEFYIDNGSGLSRDARMSAAQLLHLLQKLWQHPLRAEIVSSLPLLGVDGTLRKRLILTAPQQGHLKTGSLNRFKNIAGFVRDKQGRDLILISMTEGGSQRRAKDFQDSLMQWARRQK